MTPKLFILLFLHKPEVICIKKKKWVSSLYSKIHNPFQTKKKKCFKSWVSVHMLYLHIPLPNVLWQRLRAHCFDIIMDPFYSIFPLEKRSWALHLISMICIEEWFMTSFGLEREGFEVFGDILVLSVKEQTKTGFCYSKGNSHERGERKLRWGTIDGLCFCMKAEKQILWKGVALFFFILIVETINGLKL